MLRASGVGVFNADERDCRKMCLGRWCGARMTKPERSLTAPNIKMAGISGTIRIRSVFW